MPCHDHPDITGVLKVINGKVKIQSYTAIDSVQRPVMIGHRIQVQKEEPKILDVGHSGAAILTPSEKNFHEITAIDGNAAFFDILSPPYDEKHGGTRKCSFYRRIATNDGKLFLERTPAPFHYYCDVVAYELPENVKECDIL